MFLTNFSWFKSLPRLRTEKVDLKVINEARREKQYRQNTTIRHYNTTLWQHVYTLYFFPKRFDQWVSDIFPVFFMWIVPLFWLFSEIIFIYNCKYFSPHWERVSDSQVKILIKIKLLRRILITVCSGLFISKVLLM